MQEKKACSYVLYLNCSTYFKCFVCQGYILFLQQKDSKKLRGKSITFHPNIKCVKYKICAFMRKKVTPLLFCLFSKGIHSSWNNEATQGH